MKSFTKHYTIKASLKSVWSALVEPAVMKEWVGENVQMGDKVGDTFSLWSNSIYGKNIEVVVMKKLVQDWYGGAWEEPSKVSFFLSEKDGIVEAILVHENLPDGEADSFNSGWDEFYMGPIAKFCESNA